MELQEKFENKIIEIIEYIKDYSSYDILSYFYNDYKMCLTSREGKDTRYQKSKNVMYLQILLMCAKEQGKFNKQVSEEYFIKLEKYIEELQNIVLEYEINELQGENLSDDETEYLIHSISFSNWSGKRYDIFEVQHHIDLLNCFCKEFVETYRFDLSELYNGIEKLKENFYFVFENKINELRDLLKRGNVDLIKKDDIIISDKVDEEQKLKIKEYLELIFSLDLAKINGNTNWNELFLNEFILEDKDIKMFLADINIRTWNSLLNKKKYKPLMKINGEYYLLLEQKFYDNLDRGVIKGLCKNSKLDSQKIMTKFTTNIENVVAKYLNQILGADECYCNNYFSYKGKILENDILIRFNNIIFIVEVKAGSFTPELASEDLESHKRSLQDLLTKANEQQLCLENCLRENKIVSIYDSNNKKTRKKKTDISINDSTKIFKIIVTAECFNDIEARADKVKILKLSGNPLVLSLDDLRVYSDYFNKQPYHFIQYLFQREKAIGNSNMELYDELYHLGMWIEYNYYNETVNARINELIEKDKIIQPLGEIAIIGEDWMDEIDEYYNNLWFKRKTIEKPSRKLTDEIKIIIDYCERHTELEYITDLAVFMLGVSQETMRQVDKIIVGARNFYKKEKRSKYRFYVVEG